MRMRLQLAREKVHHVGHCGRISLALFIQKLLTSNQTGLNCRALSCFDALIRCTIRLFLSHAGTPERGRSTVRTPACEGQWQIAAFHNHQPNPLLCSWQEQN